MMHTLDRYIIRNLLINFAALLAVMIGLFVVVDLIIDLDEFVQAAHARQTRGGGGGFLIGLALTVVDYYGPLTLLLYVFFCGLLVVGAVGFTFTAMQRAREVTALLACGVSAYRIALPVLIVGSLLNVAALPIHELLIPPLASKLIRGKSDVKRESIRSFPVYFAADAEGRLWSAADFHAGQGRLDAVRIIERNPDTGQTTRRIEAASAIWQPDNQTPTARGGVGDVGQGAWLLTQGIATTTPTSNTAGTDGRGKTEAIDRITTELTPGLLLARRAGNYPNLLPISALQAMRLNPAVEPQLRAKLTQTILSRFSLLVLNVLVLVLAIPFFLTRTPGNLFAQGVKAAAVCVGTWGGGLALLQMPANTLNPVVAAWLPVAIAVPVVAWMVLRIRT